MAATILHDLHDAISDESSQELLLEEGGSMKYSIMPRSANQKPDDRMKLAYILPEYFGEDEDGSASIAN